MKKTKILVYMLILFFISTLGTTRAAADEKEPLRSDVTLKFEGTVELNNAVANYRDTDGTAKILYVNGDTLASVPQGAAVIVAYTTEVDDDKITVTLEPEGIEIIYYTKCIQFYMVDEPVIVTITDEDKDQNTLSETPNGGNNNVTSLIDKITEDDVEIWYSDESIAIECDSQVYYQIVKKESDKSGLKTANWVKAAKQNNKGKYWIDFSGTANSKDVFIALTTDSTKGDADHVVTLDAVVKSVKATLNYQAEIVENGLADVIANLDIKGVEGKDNNKNAKVALYTHDDDSVTDSKEAVYSVVWKRGTYGYWDYAECFGQLEWDMLKASNSTLYIAVCGKITPPSSQNEEAVVEEFRFSKETKVKIPKPAKAPNVKVDYVKGTLSLKNGMQIRVETDVDSWTEWMDVIAYDKTAQNNGIFALAEKNLKTSAKVSKVSVDDFVAAINDEKILNYGVADGEKLKLEVRNCATEKKFPSMTGIMEIVLPEAKPTVGEGEKNLTYTAKVEKTPAEYKVKFSELFTKVADKQYTDYEYVLVGDKTKGVNLEKQKWTKLTGDEVDWSKNVGKKYTYYEKGSTEKKTVEYEKIDAIYIRLAAKKAESKDTVGVFASDYAIIDVEVVESATTSGGEKQESAKYTISWTEYEHCETTVTYGAGVEVISGVTQLGAGEVVYLMIEPDESYRVEYYVVYGDKAEIVKLTGDKEVFGRDIFSMPEGDVTIMQSVSLND